MTPVDPCVDVALVPSGSVPVVIAKDQPEYLPLPSIVTPGQIVITRWAPTDDERIAIARGADVFLTIFGTPIRPVILSAGPIDWTQV